MGKRVDNIILMTLDAWQTLLFTVTLGSNKQLSDLFLCGHGGSMKTEKETLMM
jgi:hypothetical protein